MINDRDILILWGQEKVSNYGPGAISPSVPVFVYLMS